VLGTLEATDLGEDCNRSERDDRTDTRNRFQSFHCIAPLACTVTETEVERAHPLGGLAPYGIVMAHVLLELFGDDGFQPFGDNTFYYESADCSGQGYVMVNFPGSASYNQGTLYYPNLATAQTITALSEVSAPGPGPGRSCTRFSGTPPGITAQVAIPETFDLSTLGFTPPFSVKEQ
jgi:hypothetical protein